MPKADAVDDELLASLKGNTPAPKIQKPPVVQKATPKPATPKKAEDKIIPATVSLRSSEHDLADGILSALRKAGVRGNFTDAIKVALRLCQTDNAEALKEAYEAGRAGDGRRKRS